MAPFLDLQLLITEGVSSTSIYDKRDAFDFPMSLFPTCQAISQIKVLMEHSFVNLFDMPVAALFYLTSLLELCYLLRN